MQKTITSRDNKIIKLLISLQKRSARQKHSLFVAEGKRLCEEALKWYKDGISFFAVSESFFKKSPDFCEDFETVILPDALFCTVCKTETPQGVLSVLKIPSTGKPLKSDKALILDGVSEPGNMGTILRTAEAMGFYDIFITKGSADVFSPKVVRSTMGAVFRLSFHFEDSVGFISDLKNKNYKIISAALRNSVPLQKVSVPQKCAVVIGNEAVGISDEVLEASDIIAKIEMSGNAESLNAAIAAGIIMYSLSQKER